VFSSIAETTGLSKRDVSAVFDAMAEHIRSRSAAVGPRPLRFLAFQIVVQHKPATRTPETNPFTGNRPRSKAKPARNVVRSDR
jgi:hypothetical protein